MSSDYIQGFQINFDALSTKNKLFPLLVKKWSCFLHSSTKVLPRNLLWFRNLDSRFPVQQYTITDESLLHPGRMPERTLILNSIAEPDVEGASLAMLKRYLAANPNTLVINHPEAVIATARDANYVRLMGSDGIHFPRTVRLNFEQATGEDVTDAITGRGFSGPVIIREVGTQTGRTVGLITNLDDPQAYIETYPDQRLSGEFYVITYRDLCIRPAMAWDFT